MLARLATLVACGLIAWPVAAQTALDIGRSLAPNPVTVALTVGQWLLRNQEPVYYVRVRSGGVDETQAREQGFKLAVNKAIGSIVVSESVVENHEVVRNDIINYSSGYVSDFKIRSTTAENGLIFVDMDVWVKRSRLADRLLAQSNSAGKIDSDKVAVRYQSLLQERSQGDRLLGAVMQDFPRLAFRIEQGQHRIQMSSDRTLNLELLFKISWNREYLESLRETVTAVSQNSSAGSCLGRFAQPCDHLGYVVIKGRPGPNGWTRTMALDDLNKMKILHSNLIDSRPVMLVSVTNQAGQTVHKGCYRTTHLDNITEGEVIGDRLIEIMPNGYQINGYVLVDARLPLKLSYDQAVYTKIDQVKAEIVRLDQCK